MFKKVALSALFLAVLAGSTFVTPDVAEAHRRGRRPYASYYYGPPVYHWNRPYRSYYGGRYYRPYYRPNYYYYPGDYYYYGPRNGVNLQFGF